MMMTEEIANGDKLQRALHHLESGLEFLDQASAPSHIGANVDFAIHQLRNAIAAIVEVEPVRS